MNPDVYVSDDGGYSWFKALNGPHHYSILDSGGLIVAVEHNPTKPVNQIKYVPIGEGGVRFEIDGVRTRPNRWRSVSTVGRRGKQQGLGGGAELLIM